MQTAHRRYVIPLLLLAGVLMVLARPDRPASDIRARIQQRLIEAELGSATRFHLADGPRAALPPSDAPLSKVLAQLRSAWPEHRWAAAEEISARRDPRAVEAVIRVMREPGDTLRVCLMASTLGYLHDPRALGPLTEAAFDPANRDLRLCAIESLGMLGDRRAVPDLIRALETRNMPVTAANALARLGDPRAVTPLIAAADDPALALWMIMALGELGQAQALPYLDRRAMRDDDNRTLRRAVQEAIWKIGRLSAADSGQALADTLNSDADVDHRTWAAFRLGEASDAAAVPALLDALSDTDDGVRERAAAALIRIGAAARTTVFAHAMQTGDGQAYAVAVLGYLGEPADIAYLQSLAESSRKPLATIAARSAVLIGKFHTAEHARGLAGLQ
jgi:HEAT repeat protein